MKRVLLFSSSFIIVLGAAGALWLGLFATTFQREHFRATMGNAHAQHATAFLYMNGKAGAEKDEAAARRWYEKAAKGGIDAAAFNLGLMLQRGQGGEKDETRACALFRETGGKGSAQGQMSAARCAFLGLGGTEKSDAAGAEWVKKAAEGQSSEAEALLGILYLGGIGVAQDHAAAARWLKSSREPTARDLANQLDAQSAMIDALPPETREEKWKEAYAEWAAGIRDDFERIVGQDTGQPAE